MFAAAQRASFWRTLWVLLLLVLVVLMSCEPPPTPPPRRSPPPQDPLQGSLFRVGVGSCNFQFREQPHWRAIVARKPHLWIWMGDAIYADTYDVDRLAAEYQIQLHHKEYQALLSSTPIIGVWDDHDYGFNDVDGSYPHKVQGQTFYLDFVQEPQDSPRRKQQGIYATYLHDVGRHTLRIILLDVRYHKGPTGTELLGAAQWRWLETTLAASKADLHFIVSPTQVLRDAPGKDTWAQYPGERKRLFALLKAQRTPGVVLLTGDIHVGELSRRRDTAVGYPIYEFTSSGLTHTRLWYDLPNRYRLKLYRERNFGMIDLVPDGDDLAIHLQLYHIDGSLQLHQRLSLSSLQPPE